MEDNVTKSCNCDGGYQCLNCREREDDWAEQMECYADFQRHVAYRRVRFAFLLNEVHHSTCSCHLCMTTTRKPT